MNWITIVIGFIKELIKPISVAIGSFLLFKQGKEAADKEAAEEHVQDAKEAQAINDHISTLPEPDVDAILRPRKRDWRETAD